jgi:hypothetical protein
MELLLLAHPSEVLKAALLSFPFCSAASKEEEEGKETSPSSFFCFCGCNQSDW